MPRFATIDVGTNSVLLLVADRTADGRFQPVVEHAEITRLGRGVDASGVLSPEGMEETLTVLARFAEEARALGVEGLAVTATSAARDARNGADFLTQAQTRAGVNVEIITGEHEAQLSYAAVFADVRAEVAGRSLIVIDIGGGSTEFIYGGQGAAVNKVSYRRSFDVGSVRLTERFVREDPISPETQARIADFLRQTFSELPDAPEDALVVGVAGTVTTLFTVENGIEPYDPARVEGGVLPLASLTTLRTRLCGLSLAERRNLIGLQPKRADVIGTGALILEAALERLHADSCRVSDRGVRWGLLAERWGLPS